MPKTIKSHCKSGRKALSNISNCNQLPNKNKTVSKEVASHNNGRGNADDNCAIDRLHAAHKSLSQLINQIDGLVVRAHKLNLAHKLGECDIECFIEVLLSTHSTLKGWLPKFEQAFSCHSDISAKQPLPLSPVVPSSAINDKNLFSLNNSRSSLSPSPLVSWPLGITTDCGRELFALTPLPKFRTSTDFKGFSTAEPTACGDKGELASVLTPLPFQHLNKLQGKIADDNAQKLEAVIPEQVEVVTPKISKCHTSKSTQTFRGSPLQCLKEDTSKMFATPGLAISPPKTCFLMRPISKPLQLQNDGSVESTPPITVNFRKFDESLSSDDSPIPKSLRIKYPDLFKKVADNCPPMKTPVQVSPQLVMSPPKTCVLMVPSTDSLSDGQDIFDSDKSFERDKYSHSSVMPHNLFKSIDCDEAGKRGGYIDKTNPDAKVFTASYSNSLCQAFDVPTFSSKMEQSEEVAKKFQEPCETTSTVAEHEENKVSTYVCRSLHDSDPAHPRLSMAESTPICKLNSSNVQNTEQRARQPGEQTLRRELWSKLKAASADAYPKASKDFLSNLQETSIEHNSRTNNTSHICSLAESSLSSKNGAIPEKRRIDLAKSATRITVKQNAQGSYTRDMLKKAGDVSILDPMKRAQMVKPSKTDSTIMRNSRYQRRVKQADEASYITHFHAP